MTEKFPKDKRIKIGLYALACLICGAIGWSPGVLMFSVGLNRIKKGT